MVPGAHWRIRRKSQSRGSSLALAGWLDVHAVWHTLSGDLRSNTDDHCFVAGADLHTPEISSAISSLVGGTHPCRVRQAEGSWLGKASADTVRDNLRTMT